MLKASNLHVYYGAIHAIKDVSFHVDKGEIVTLIGANGRGQIHYTEYDKRPAASARGQR